MKPLCKISTQWSSNLAYITGLITSDGNLSSNGRGMTFVSKDVQLIKTFTECLGISPKVSLKKSGFNPNKKYYFVQFTDINFYNFLLSIGLTPRKSLTLGPLKIPQKYFVDFARGCFDGDGSIYSYMDPRWANSHMFYISYASASKLFIHWFRDQFSNLVGIHGHISMTRNMLQLRFAKKESLVLIRKMYYNKQIPCLERKREKIISILEKHQNTQLENPRIFLKKTREINI